MTKRQLYLIIQMIFLVGVMLDVVINGGDEWVKGGARALLLFGLVWFSICVWMAKE